MTAVGDPRPLLAHLAAGALAHQAEDLTTEAVAVLLARPAAAEVLARLARHLDVQWTDQPTVVTTQWATVDTGTPDLAVVVAGTVVAFIEAKFEAGLTIHQPVSYLKALPADGLCLFVVPQRRLLPVWAELRRRVDALDALFEPSPAARVCRVGERWLGIVTWQLLCDLVRDAFQAAEDRAGLSDLDQVVGLCTELEGRVAAPWDSETITGPIPRQLLSLRPVIDEVVNRAVESGFASVANLSWSATVDPTWGRYVSLGGGICYLHVNVGLWARTGATPLWLKVGDRTGSTTEPVRAGIAAAGFALHPTTIASKPFACVPVPVAVEADSTRVVGDAGVILQAVAQIVSAVESQHHVAQ